MNFDPMGLWVMGMEGDSVWVKKMILTEKGERSVKGLATEDCFVSICAFLCFMGTYVG